MPPDVELEEYGSSRADFRHLSNAQRERLERTLKAAYSQASNAESEDWDDPKFRRAMRRKRTAWSYQAGRYNLPSHECNYIWWNFVYDKPAPYQRDKYV